MNEVRRECYQTTHLSLSMSTSDTKPHATERKEKSLLGAALRLLLDGLVVTETRSMGRTPPRQSKKQQFKRRGSRRHMSYLRKMTATFTGRDKDRTVQTTTLSHFSEIQYLGLDNQAMTKTQSCSSVSRKP